MVCASTSEERGEVTESMRMRSERSKPLHNFTLPYLRWGKQKHLRCMKVNSNGVESFGVDRRSHSPNLEESTESRSRESESEMRTFLNDLKTRPRVLKSKFKRCDDDDGIEAMREKLTFDLKTAANKIKEAILGKESAVTGEEVVEKKSRDVKTEETPAVVLSTTDARPWNLRTRRAACKAPNADGGGGGGGSKTLKIDANLDSPLRSSGDLPKIVPEKRKMSLTVSLSKKEIDEDFMEMVGLRAPRRPKKRAKAVQKQLDTLFPGMWLSEISADLYKVTESPENTKS